MILLFIDEFGVGGHSSLSMCSTLPSPLIRCVPCLGYPPPTSQLSPVSSKESSSKVESNVILLFMLIHLALLLLLDEDDMIMIIYVEVLMCDGHCNIIMFSDSRDVLTSHAMMDKNKPVNKVAIKFFFQLPGAPLRARFSFISHHEPKPSFSVLSL